MYSSHHSATALNFREELAETFGNLTKADRHRGNAPDFMITRMSTWQHLEMIPEEQSEDQVQTTCVEPAVATCGQGGKESPSAYKKGSPRNVRATFGWEGDGLALHKSESSPSPTCLVSARRVLDEMVEEKKEAANLLRAWTIRPMSEFRCRPTLSRESPMPGFARSIMETEENV
ncbi:hypothetical protein B0H12DRAFT_1075008 [Mycena haematopus]|nr:hypothetical protein B0H12DRAFT_1075008 [Mycena haematopus]